LSPADALTEFNLRDACVLSGAHQQLKHPRIEV
jgi:hypothetical protein